MAALEALIRAVEDERLPAKRVEGRARAAGQSEGALSSPCPTMASALATGVAGDTGLRSACGSC